MRFFRGRRQSIKQMKVGQKFKQAAILRKQRLQIDDAIGVRQTIFIFIINAKA